MLGTGKISLEEHDWEDCPDCAPESVEPLGAGSAGGVVEYNSAEEDEEAYLDDARAEWREDVRNGEIEF